VVPAAAAAEPPRTPWGEPELNGVWKFGTGTPLERPVDYSDKTHFNEEEAAAFLAGAPARLEDFIAAFDGGDDSYVGVEPGIETDLPLTADRRTSLIYEPADGKIPALSDDAKVRAGIELRHSVSVPDGPEDRPLTERCILGFLTGPPLTTSLQYNDYLQIFQTRDTVVILNEMINDARIVALDGSPHLPGTVRQWLGDSRGYWDGDTLVVETRNFSDRTTFNGSGMNMHLTERFTRISEDVMEYDYRIVDPESFAAPWAARSPMQLSDLPVYEYACHEENRSMEYMLSGARAQEAFAATDQAKE